jgi:ketosteroid isomerase-like protein
MARDVFDVATRFFNAIEAGDVDEVRAVYAPDAIIWHNTDNIEKTREENLATLTWAIENVERLRYENVRRYRIDGGFVQQHVCRGHQRKNGKEMILPAVVVCQVKGDNITRLDEYFDSTQAPDGVPAVER